ncbi:diguanylate cyclase [Shewanella mangrovi]|uniref:Diguanylate cyclase n=1 Tax=Shewanella mangrovi TaxID=1515746 RepID=A0A094JMG4_9GAMM|nr:EAL domain-containing protein [Shewanella mangrovi]KFZ39244.1 diguanylate cyclase [Shewanella mangrovi]
MAPNIVLVIVQNAALLLVLVIAYEAIPLNSNSRYKYAWQLLAGVIIGGLCIALMLTPWRLDSGIIYDGRAVLLCMAGLFFGAVPALFAALIASWFRLSIGGIGAEAGMAVIWASVLVGLMWRYWRHYRHEVLQSINIGELLLFSIVAQLPILTANLLLPADIAIEVMFSLAWPAFTIFPLSNALLGFLLSQRLQHKLDQKIKLQDEFLFRSQFDVGNIGISIANADMHWLKVNPGLCRMLGYSEEEMLAMTWADVTHPQDLKTDLTQYQRMMAGEIDSYELEKRFIKKNGEVVYCQITVSCKRQAGAVALVIAGYIDVTVAKVAEQKLSASYDELELVLASSGLGYWNWHIPTDKFVVDQRSAEIMRCSLETLLKGGKQLWYSTIEPRDLKSLLHQLDLHLEGRTPHFSCEFRFQRFDGQQRWMRVNGKVTERSDQGAAINICGVHEDITEQKQREHSLQLAASVYKHSTEAMTVTNSKGQVLNINPAFSAITGFREQDVIGQHVSLLKSQHHSAEDYRHIRQELNREKRWQGELWLTCKDGHEIIVWISINTLTDKEEHDQRWVALFSDITEKKNSERLIWQQANYDPLTGLPNRRMFLEQMSSEIRKAHRRSSKLALLFLDLDYFKEVNDTLGHDMGDRLLQQAAKRLKTCVRESDLVARLGGDEFTLLLMDANDSKGIERVAQQILQQLAEPFQLGDENAYISASIGITLFPDDGASEEILLKHADQAMYAAKEQGRNRFNYFTHSMQQQARYRMKLIQELREAVTGNHFEIYYQPITDLNTQQVVKVEALIRWPHAHRGHIPPAEFIPVAEDTGLIIDIGDWVFYQAVQQVVAWRETYGIDIQISINKSPIQFRDEGARFDAWLNYLTQNSVAGGSICIEITEGLLLEANDNVSTKLLRYRDAGVQVSLDDFGTGYSSLAYLKRFDIDYLKIDRSFTNQLDVDENNVTLCEAIIVMAHKLGIKVIAEGVESQQQADILKGMGCDYAQGYFYSHPLPTEQFEQAYLKHNKRLRG